MRRHIICAERQKDALLPKFCRGYASTGYAASDAFPAYSHRELWQKADERMYENKRQWYAQNALPHH